MSAIPPNEPPPASLEIGRDATLQRLVDLRKKAEEKQHAKALQELPKLDGLAQRMKNEFELAHLNMAIDYLELLVDWSAPTG